TMRDAGALVTLPAIGPAWRCAYCGVMVAASADRVTDAGSLPRDVAILVDRSRSMRGDSLAQARRAVARLIEELDPADAVQVVAFDHERVAFDGRGGEWSPREPDLGRRVAAFLEGLRPRGGTELEQALELAMALPERPARSRVVVLLTDAALGNEGRLLRRVGALVAPPKARLFVLGVGPAVNRYLVDKLARIGGGASDVLLPGEDVEIVAGRFARRVGQAGPVLRRLQLAWEDAMPADVYPNPVPDLFGGQPVQLLGRFTGDGPSRLILTGETALGEPFRQEIDVRLPTTSDEIPGLERLWARARIEARLDRLAQAPDEAGDVRAEVLGLALRHGLMSPYTALIAEDSKVVGDPSRLPRRVEVPAAPPGAGLDEADGSTMEEMAVLSEVADEPTGRFAPPDLLRLSSAPDVDDDDDDIRTSVSHEGARGGGGVRASVRARAVDFESHDAPLEGSAGFDPSEGPLRTLGFGPPPAFAPSPAAPAPAAFGAGSPAPGYGPPPASGYGPPPAPGYGPPPAPRSPSAASPYGAPPPVGAPPAASSYGAPPPVGAPRDAEAPAGGAGSTAFGRPQAPKARAESARSSPEAAPAVKSAKGGGLLGRVASFVDSLVGEKKVESGFDESEAAPAPPPPPDFAARRPPPPPARHAPSSPAPAAPPRHMPPVPSQQQGFGQGQRPPARPETEPYPDEVIAWARGRGVGDLDLVFLVDETGSMGSYIAQVKARLLELVDTLRASPLSRSLRLGLV
ncbi:MAG TPA: VWA domain-containing protein, partial [Polyangiaceae bacterium]|nr:VWA domain-containing protein [Polyangiaceae bacterium]